MARSQRFRTAVTCVLVTLGGTGATVAQVPDSVPVQRPALVVGEVVDTTGEPIAEAQVMAFSRDSVIIAETTTDTAGRFALRGIAPGGPYLFVARKLGYRPARGRNLHVTSGDTLRLRFVLPPVVLVLDSITVKARRSRYTIASSQFDPKVHRDALNLLAWKRPDMLGDPEWCPLPDTVFGGPKQDRLRLKVTDRLLFYSGNRPAGASPSRRSWIQAIRFPGSVTRPPSDSFSQFGDVFADPELPYVRQLYVNGLRADIPGDPLRTPLRILRELDTRFIEQVQYADCGNESVPVGMRYSLFIVLKPLPVATQDSLFRALLAGTASPIEGRLLSVKRPSREVWDSLVQLLTGRGDVVAPDSVQTESSP